MSATEEGWRQAVDCGQTWNEGTRQHRCWLRPGHADTQDKAWHQLKCQCCCGTEADLAD